ELLLGRAQEVEAYTADLGPHVGGVVAADRVVVGDRAAGGDDRLRSRPLDLPPLLDLLPVAGAGDEGEVERGAVRVGVREVTEDHAGGALRGERVADRASHGRVQLPQSAPGMRGLQRLD